HASVVLFAVVLVVRPDGSVGGEFPVLIAKNFRGDAVLVLDLQLEKQLREAIGNGFGGHAGTRCVEAAITQNDACRIGAGSQFAGDIKSDVASAFGVVSQSGRQDIRADLLAIEIKLE